ncbi:MAG: ubiquinol-cytochrome C chaperone family protein, partial [Pseudomonadota bacterium]
RFAAYREAFDNDDSLRIAIARNVLGAESLADESATAALADYARAMRASAEASDVLNGFAFPNPEEFLPAPERVRS